MINTNQPERFGNPSGAEFAGPLKATEFLDVQGNKLGMGVTEEKVIQLIGENPSTSQPTYVKTISPGDTLPVVSAENPIPEGAKIIVVFAANDPTQQGTVINAGLPVTVDRKTFFVLVNGTEWLKQEAATEFNVDLENFLTTENLEVFEDRFRQEIEQQLSDSDMLNASKFSSVNTDLDQVKEALATESAKIAEQDSAIKMLETSVDEYEDDLSKVNDSIEELNRKEIKSMSLQVPSTGNEARIDFPEDFKLHSIHFSGQRPAYFLYKPAGQDIEQAFDFSKATGVLIKTGFQEGFGSLAINVTGEFTKPEQSPVTA